ncbi:MAG TPA: hypothetical protein VFW00_05885 [Rhodocyclaceae bacterium]|nr:hypothetical protein [Rhodocyclaceae bacterium]
MADETSKSWWQTLPVILGGIAALITAITGLITALSKTHVSHALPAIPASAQVAVAPKPAAAAETTIKIAGKWSGQASESAQKKFLIALFVKDDCKLNEKCGRIAVSEGAGPCFGEISLKQEVDGDYEFSVDNFDARSKKSVCTPGAGEHFRLGNDGKLLYRTSYSQATGTLSKVLD